MNDHKQKFTLVLVGVMAVISVFVRLVPHWPNFTPVGALALFAGLYTAGRWPLLLPIGVMLLSDMAIGFYDWRVMLAVYLGFFVYSLIGRLVQGNKSFFSVVGGTFAGALSFYLLTNWAVWAFSGMYPHTWSGLILCYELALPFFRNTLLGDLFYGGVFIVAYELAFKVWSLMPRWRLKMLVR